ncbi:MAG TPA: putative photosynthetic complex assembly protein PuhE [Beijerinckiaceae bacterium]|jgi:putative photosynthetic complex assembly protein 2
MTQHAPALLYALFLWWFSTGAVLRLCRRELSNGRAWLWAGLAAVSGLALLAASASLASVAGAYLAFTAAVLTWGSVEITFLTGLLTGPRRQPCPAGARGWRRTRAAFEAILYHELALVAAGVAIAAATWGGANQVGPQTFLVLWLLRLSAKLNLFLGVPVTNEAMLPERLRFLASYFALRPINPLFPVSVTAATAGLAVITVRALAPEASAFDAAGSILLATLLALAVLEHWFMVLPIPSASLWTWSLGTPAAVPSPLLSLVATDQDTPLGRRPT